MAEAETKAAEQRKLRKVLILFNLSPIGLPLQYTLLTWGFDLCRGQGEISNGFKCTVGPLSGYFEFMGDMLIVGMFSLAIFPWVVLNAIVFFWLFFLVIVMAPHR